MRIVAVVLLAGAMFLVAGAASAQIQPPLAAKCEVRADCPKGDDDLWCNGYQVCVIPEGEVQGECVNIADNNPCDNQGTKSECVELPGQVPAYLCTTTCDTDADCDYGTCDPLGYCVDGECSSDAECDDNDVCTGIETCSSDGVCINPDDLECDELCDPILGCIDCLTDADCDYGTCSPEGVCVDGECSSDAECDDNDICTGVETCGPDGVCIDGDDLECDDFCDSVLGCVECLTNDDCPFGTCSGEGQCLDGGCSSDAECDDNDVCNGVETCTNDGECTEPDDLECDDLCDPILGCVDCLTNADCPFGTCVEGVCEDGECASDAECDDNDICTGVETCSPDGVCIDPDDLECDELCDPILGCVECLINEDCPSGTCSGEGICLPGGCSSDADCDDNSICTGVETCTNDGECTEPDPLECPELCDPVLGCVECLDDEDCPFGTCVDGTCEEGECSSDAECDDNDVCTGEETCSSDGVCINPADLTCPDFCDPTLGCVECLEDEDCDFGICTPEGVCLEGGCTGDEDCDDNNICNGVEMCMNDGTCFSPDPVECPESCDPLLGCVQCLEDEDCPDEGDICAEGECLPRPQTICGLKIRPKKLKVMALFKKGQRVMNITAIKGEEDVFDPYGEISIGEFVAQRAWIKINKKKGALLRVKVTVPDTTLINDIPRGSLTVTVGDCSGQVEVK